MTRNEEIALGILAEIDKARSGRLALDELEQSVWRLLDSIDESFPRILAGQVDEFVQQLRYLQRENLAYGRGREVDENQGADVILNEVANALGRFLG